jgi:hypothetical protein
MADYKKVGGALGTWIGMPPTDFAVLAAGGGTAQILVDWLQSTLGSTLPTGLTTDWLQAIAGVAIAKAGTYYGHNKVALFGTGILLDEFIKLVKAYIHPGGSLLVENPKTVGAPMPSMNINDMARQAARMEVRN